MSAPHDASIPLQNKRAMAQTIKIDSDDRQDATSQEVPKGRSPFRRKSVAVGAVAIVAIALLAFGVQRILFGRTHVRTDNAQVDGRLTPVLARTGGFVSEVRVEDNQRVQEGDTLVILDDRDLRSQLAQADAELAALLTGVRIDGHAGRAEAQATAARATAAAAAAQVEQARAGAEKASADLARISTLAARNIVSQQQLDAAQAASGAANAQLAVAQRNALAAQAETTVAQADISTADARVAAARAARDQVALELSYTRVIVPTNGVVSKKSVEIGQYVQPGQPLMTVVPLADVWVVANLKETELSDVHPGEGVEITVDAYPGTTFHGVVESISPATGAKFSLLPPDNATGNFTKVIQRVPVRIRIDDDGHPEQPLRPGMSAEVTITTG